MRKCNLKNREGRGGGHKTRKKYRLTIKNSARILTVKRYKNSRKFYRFPICKTLLFRERKSQNQRKCFEPEFPVVNAVADTKFDRHFCAVHLRHEVEIRIDKSVVVATVQHPTYGTQLLHLLGSCISQIFDRRGLGYRHQPTRIVILGNGRAIAMVEQTACRVCGNEEVGVSLSIDKGSATTHRKTRYGTPLLRGYCSVGLVDTPFGCGKFKLIKYFLLSYDKLTV